MSEIIELLEKCNSIDEISIKMYGYSNGRVNKKIKELVIKHGYEYKFFTSSEVKYNDNPKICKLCLTKISFDKRFNDFCSSKCSVTYNNKLRKPYSDELKEKISLSLKCVEKGGTKILEQHTRFCSYCNKEFVVSRKNNYSLSKRKTCSDECHSLLRSKNSKESVERQIKNGTHKGWQSRNIISYPEKFFITVLNNNNLKYEHNKTIKKIDLGVIKDDSNYFLDFYFEDKKIDLEIDGRQHDDRIEHDNTRDELLIKNGFKVYRIKWKSINSEKGKEYMKKEINDFLSFYNDN